MHQSQHGRTNIKQTTIKRITRALAALALLLIPTLSVFAQQRATTETGETVLLYADGTWEFADADETERSDAPVTLDLIRFGFTESGPANDYANDYRDWFDIVFKVNNITETDIRAARGVVLFQDLFGDTIWRVNLQVSDPIPAGDSITWMGSVDFQTFNDSHRRMKNMRTQDMMVEYGDVEAIYEPAE